MGNRPFFMLQFIINSHYIVGGVVVSKYNKFFENLCEKYYKDIYKYIYFSIKNRDTANDITQDTFIVVYKNIEKIYKYENPGGFIFKTAQNLIKNYKKEIYKKLIKETSLDESIIYIEDNYTSIEKILNDKIDVYEYIDDIIESLSSEKYRLYKLYYIDGISMKKIAEDEGIEYPALRMKYVRLRNEIKKKVKEVAENNFVT